MTLVEKLDKLMIINKLTIAEVSRGANIPDSTLRSLYNNGSENIKLSNLKKLAHFFNVSLDYLADNNVTVETDKVITRQYTTRVYSLEELNELDGFAQFLLKRRAL